MVATGSFHFSMLAGGIKELKNRLSEFVREVARGEVVLVTDRGRVVAELRPPGRAASVSLSERERLDALVARSGGVRARRPPAGELFHATGIELEGTSAQAALDWVRAETQPDGPTV